MGCGDEELSKYLTQTFTAHCNALICQQVTLSGDAEWPKVADAVIEAIASTLQSIPVALARIIHESQTRLWDSLQNVL
jgi:hypothetical protein